MITELSHAERTKQTLINQMIVTSAKDDVSDTEIPLQAEFRMCTYTRSPKTFFATSIARQSTDFIIRMLH